MAHVKGDIDPETLRARKHVIVVAAELFKVSVRTVSRIMAAAKQGEEVGLAGASLVSKRKEHSGRHCGLTGPVKYRIKALNRATKGRLSIRSLAKQFSAADIPLAKSTLHRWLPALDAKLVRTYVKPMLQTHHVLHRLQFILQRVHYGSFIPLKNVIHVNEKWFNTVPLKRKVRVMGEEVPQGGDTVHHKSHIPKIMFLAAIGLPQDIPAADGGAVGGGRFDGKIGIWPFAETIAAKRNSKHRPAGTPVLTPVSVTAEVYLDMVLKPGGLIDAIKLKMPWLHGKPIEVQQDGATPHSGHGNLVHLTAAGHVDGWQITFVTQPAQSPDFNKLDLCFFFTACSSKLRSSRTGRNHCKIWLLRLKGPSRSTLKLN